MYFYGRIGQTLEAENGRNCSLPNIVEYWSLISMHTCCINYYDESSETIWYLASLVKFSLGWNDFILSFPAIIGNTKSPLHALCLHWLNGKWLDSGHIWQISALRWPKMAVIGLWNADHSIQVLCGTYARYVNLQKWLPVSLHWTNFGPMLVENDRNWSFVSIIWKTNQTIHFIPGVYTV